MRRRHARTLALSTALCGLLVLGGTPPADAATVGTLTQLSGTAGCIVDASTPIGGCAAGNAMLGTAPFFGSHAVAISPDGKNVYAASFNSNAVTVFGRNTSSGALTQKPGTSGCVALDAVGCAHGAGLVKPTSVEVSPDGKSVYAASIIAGSVTIFDRNPSTGTLVQKQGVSGCIAHAPTPGCAAGRGLDGADVVVVSPDNKHVYVGSFKSNGVAAFLRNRSTGALSQLAGSAGCVLDSAAEGCAVGRGLTGAEGMTVSPDGKTVYVGAAVGNAVAVLNRNASTGALNQPAGTSGCVAFEAGSGCANGFGLVGADSLQVSPDNRNLYVASGVGSSVAAFKRNAKTGQIQQLAGVAGCYTDHQHSLGRCNTGVALDTPEGIAVSPDGNTVYVGSFNSNSVTVFDRVSFTGTITQRPGANGCIVNVPTSGCTTGRALGNANAIAISPYGGSVYVGSYASNAIASFTRAQPRNGHVAVSVDSTLTVAPRSVISVPITCRGTAHRRCPGGLTLRASSRLLASTSTDVPVGEASFNLARGSSERVSVRLSSSAHRYLLDNGSLPVVMVMRVVQPSGRIETFRKHVLLKIVVGKG